MEFMTSEDIVEKGKLVRDISEMNIQAFINNISFPKTIEELEYFVKEVGRFGLTIGINQIFLSKYPKRWF